jgi:CheY-like chemotaxis protein
VWTAESGPNGIELLDAHPEISAVVLDLAMPLMTGDQVAPVLHSRRPDLPIIVSSGYSEQEAVRHLRETDVAAFFKSHSAKAEYGRL